jgi:uncharacterized DUF497 family protein
VRPELSFRSRQPEDRLNIAGCVEHADHYQRFPFGSVDNRVKRENEAKREWVLTERGIDFLRIADIFDGRPVLTVPTLRKDEKRYLTVGLIEEKFFAVVWMWREGTIPIVPARRARDEEENVTVRYTAEQIKSRINRGEDRTDWTKAHAMSGRKLEASIRADPDDIAGEPDWSQAVMGVPAPKDHINIPIDHDVLEWFKDRGKGYQRS